MTFEPDHCTFYKSLGNSTQDTCEHSAFSNQTERCHEWVFDPHERSIVNDVSSTKISIKQMCSF